MASMRIEQLIPSLVHVSGDQSPVLGIAMAYPRAIKRTVGSDGEAFGQSLTSYMLNKAVHGTIAAVQNAANASGTLGDETSIARRVTNAYREDLPISVLAVTERGWWSFGAAGIAEGAYAEVWDFVPRQQVSSFAQIGEQKRSFSIMPTYSVVARAVYVDGSSTEFKVYEPERMQGAYTA